ncbi:phytoene desaturase family protein [Nocardioides luteus]|uniref:phytoene desaturase family protein n=1 Tax=Nocardioides luteus TaxID=1844 RepID=UPI0018C99F62|nr:NAD(P)/FAD-dependent oxidoreductase [Nocardioides luteus]MBG6095608.1 phytoene dehydrogenase-like protein [Nocardioides luteus]
MSEASYDAVVVGSGPNGLVAANLLADKGWSVLVLEAQPTTGGAVRSSEDVHPGFIHDTFSAFYPLAAASPTIRGLGLDEYGLRWRHAPAVLGHPMQDGSWALLHRDRHVTAELLDAQHAGDGDAWLELCGLWDHIGEPLVHALLTPFPPLRPGAHLLNALRRAGGLAAVRTLLTPAGDLARTHFGGEAARLLLAGNAGHADIPLDALGSGTMGLLLAMLGQTVGFPVPEGGAGMLAAALERRFREQGGDVRCGAEVIRLGVEDGRVTDVRTRDGDRIKVDRAVIAAVAAPHLYGRLLDPTDVPRRVAAGMENFQLDPGTVKVDWALRKPIPWLAEPAYAPGTFHVADSVEQMTESLSQVSAGVIPDAPFLLAGQMTTTDPSRSPAGTESVWAYTHVPQTVLRDAGPDGLRGRWDEEERERFADRMQARIERLAPGFGSAVAARRVLGPHEFEALDANLIGGAIGGGTSQLHQQLVFRPVPGTGRAETGITGLFLGSASAHPGGGVHGAAGSNAARAALLHDRLRWRGRRQARSTTTR